MFFFFQAEDGIRDVAVTGVQTCALPISRAGRLRAPREGQLVHARGEPRGQVRDEGGLARRRRPRAASRSEEHTSELQSRLHLVCRLLLEKKKKNTTAISV